MVWINLAAWVGTLVCGMGAGYCLNGWLGLFTGGLVVFGASFVFTTMMIVPPAGPELER